ncbi:MAG TPA: hypothetical protein VHR45_03135 [Thermoanaerobaculia bacterium]|nr:hypothetical protein [Thermoanaerobaculia bacterium]
MRNHHPCKEAKRGSTLARLPRLAVAVALLCVGSALSPIAWAASLAEASGGGTRTMLPYSPARHLSTPGGSLGERSGGLPEPILEPQEVGSGLTMRNSITVNWGPSGVRFQIGRITNDRYGGISGSLSLQLWAERTAPIYGQSIFHQTLGSYSLGPLQAGSALNNVDSGNVAYTEPPAGCYYITVALVEDVGGGTSFYVDLATFSSLGVHDASGFDLFSFGGATCTATTACVRDANTACLHDGRFKVTVTYATASSNGSGQVMGFGGQRAEGVEAAYFWFFNAANFEMGLKVLDACGLNNHFWVFISGLTDQGWTVKVLDRQTGVTATYSNPVGHLTSTVADTSALNCP